MFKMTLKITLGMAAVCCLVSCMTEQEFRLRKQDPSRISEEIDRDRRTETIHDMEKQTGKEDAVSDKQLNEIIDKQLHNQTKNKETGLN